MKKLGEKPSGGRNLWALRRVPPLIECMRKRRVRVLFFIAAFKVLGVCWKSNILL